jgi:hypothetical protein
MDNRLALILFLIIVTATSIFWGRINRIGCSKSITSIVHFIMKYSKMNAELIRSYMVWFIYMFVGLGAAVALLTAYQVNLQFEICSADSFSFHCAEFTDRAFDATSARRKADD